MASPRSAAPMYAPISVRASCASMSASSCSATASPFIGTIASKAYGTSTSTGHDERARCGIWHTITTRWSFARRGAGGHYGGRVSRFVVDITPLKKYRHFRRLWAGQVVSGLGSQLTLVAVSFQAYALTRSTLVVGLVGLAQLVPLLAGALWGGALADAMDRRKLLIITQVAMATGVGGLVVNASFSHPRVWPLFVCTAANAGFQGMDWPTRRAALPMLVDGQDVTAAIALQTTIQQLALVAGPALAGVLIATIGLSAVYGIDVASFSAALIAVLLLPPLMPSGGGTPTGLRSMGEGFRHLRRERLLSAT